MILNVSIQGSFLSVKARVMCLWHRGEQSAVFCESLMVALQMKILHLSVDNHSCALRGTEASQEQNIPSLGAGMFTWEAVRERLFQFQLISRHVLHPQQWPVHFWGMRIEKHSKRLYLNSQQWLPRSLWTESLGLPASLSFQTVELFVLDLFTSATSFSKEFSLNV